MFRIPSAAHLRALSPPAPRGLPPHPRPFLAQACPPTHPSSTPPALPHSYEEDDASDEDYEPGGGAGSAGASLATAADVALPGGPQRIVVEAILAWRWPMQALAAGVVIPPAPVQIPLPPTAAPAPGAAAPEGPPAAAPAPADGPAPMTVDEAAAAVQPKQEPAAGGSEQPPASAAPASGEQPAAPPAAEVDAVAALLSASAGTQPPPIPLPLPAGTGGAALPPLPVAVPGGMPPLPLPLPEDGVAAAAAALAAASAGPAAEPEYLVKYVGRSHAHNEWVPEATLMQIAKRKVGGAGAATGLGAQV